MTRQRLEAPSQPPSISVAIDEDVARYISQMAAELRDMTAGRPRFRSLRYLLDMARLEAERAAQGRPD